MYVSFVDIYTREAVAQHMEKFEMRATNKITLPECKATTKEVHIVDNQSVSNEQPFFIGAIGSKQVTDKDCYVNLQINN